MIVTKRRRPGAIKELTWVGLFNTIRGIPTRSPRNGHVIRFHVAAEAVYALRCLYVFPWGLHVSRSRIGLTLEASATSCVP
jgi:hypothetical protein